MKKEAMFWKRLGTKAVQCQLCPHHCTIQEGNRGICGVRENESGKLFSLIYASCSSIHDDPIEKKPLYHFHPGSSVLSLGSVGCNFRCEHCQNYSISAAAPEEIFFEEVSAENAVKRAKEHRCQGIAWTYNEPTIWHEYTSDCARLAKKAGLYTVYVTNGYMQEAPLKDIAPYLDAMNIDVKAFREEFYKKVCQARLEPVIRTCELAKKLGIHIELTYLVIPGLNDSPVEIKEFCQWVVEKLSSDTPVHFSRFHPDYKMKNVTATPVSTLLSIYTMAKEAGVQYVYLGNVPHGEYENTMCPSCGNLLVERQGYTIQMRGISHGTCQRCHTPIPLYIE